MYRNFDELSNAVKTKPGTLVVAAAHDSHTLEAVFLAVKRYKINYILIGDKEKIQTESSKLDFSADTGSIIDNTDDAENARIAVSLIKEGRGNALMKGLLDTGTLLSAVLDKETGIRDSDVLSHLAVLEVPAYHKLIGITDGGMIPNPTLEQKACITRNAANFFRSIGYECPKIAALCASETVNPKITETLDAAELQKMCNRGELGDCLLEGPLSFDIAINRESAMIKGYSGNLAGDTDIMLVPAISAGNILAKGLIYWAGAKMAGCILGAKTPIVLTSRGSSTAEKLMSIMLCVIS